MKKQERLEILEQLFTNIKKTIPKKGVIKTKGLKKIIKYYSESNPTNGGVVENQPDQNDEEKTDVNSENEVENVVVETEDNTVSDNLNDLNVEIPTENKDTSHNTDEENSIKIDPSSNENEMDDSIATNLNETTDNSNIPNKAISSIKNDSPNIANLINLPKTEEKKVIKQESKKYQAKNGQVGVKYSLSIQELPIGSEIIIEEIEGLEERGLKYSKIDSEISGQPTEAGEFEFPIKFKFDGKNSESRPALTKVLKILINPDPKSLWKELEPPESDLYRKPHFDYKCSKFNEYQVYGASIRGRSHAHAGTHRDDDFLIAELSKNVLLAIVADGAGSAKYSREGSRLACAACLKSINDNIENLNNLEKLLINRDEESNKELSTLAYNLIGDAVKKSYSGLTEKANESNHVLKDYSTTLLLSLIIKTDTEYCIISYGLGDGIASILENDKPILLTTPDSGQHAGQTRFITMSDTLQTIHNRMKINFTVDLKNTFLMTDGISDVFFETDSRLEKMEDWQKLMDDMEEDINFQEEEIETQFKKWINFFSKGNHDDRTIIWIR